MNIFSLLKNLVTSPYSVFTIGETFRLTDTINKDGYSLQAKKNIAGLEYFVLTGSEPGVCDLMVAKTGDSLTGELKERSFDEILEDFEQFSGHDFGRDNVEQISVRGFTADEIVDIRRTARDRGAKPGFLKPSLHTKNSFPVVSDDLSQFYLMLIAEGVEIAAVYSPTIDTCFISPSLIPFKKQLYLHEVAATAAVNRIIGATEKNQDFLERSGLKGTVADYLSWVTGFALEIEGLGDPKTKLTSGYLYGKITEKFMEYSDNLPLKYPFLDEQESRDVHTTLQGLIWGGPTPVKRKLIETVGGNFEVYTEWLNWREQHKKDYPVERLEQLRDALLLGSLRSKTNDDILSKLLYIRKCLYTDVNPRKKNVYKLSRDWNISQEM